MTTEQHHEHPLGRFRFCPLCGSPLEVRRIEEKERLACTSCYFVHYRDPKVAAGVVVEQDGKILLTRRAHEPKLGQWTFPSGYVDAGERVEAAGAREVEEETGILVDIQSLLGVYSEAGDHVIFIAYAGKVKGGTLAPGPEAIEVGFFPPNNLPKLAFEHDEQILDAWMTWMERGL